MHTGCEDCKGARQPFLGCIQSRKSEMYWIPASCGEDVLTTWERAERLLLPRVAPLLKVAATLPAHPSTFQSNDISILKTRKNILPDLTGQMHKIKAAQKTEVQTSRFRGVSLRFDGNMCILGQSIGAHCSGRAHGRSSTRPGWIPL